MPASLPPIAPILGFDGRKLDIQLYLEEDYADVSDAAREIPAVMEWLNELRQAYQEDRDRLKSDLEVAEARAYFDLKGTGEGNFQANYQCKPTEEGLKMAIALDATSRKLRDQLTTTSAMVGRLSGTLASLQAKVELIRSSEATRRSAFNETTPSR